MKKYQLAKNLKLIEKVGLEDNRCGWLKCSCTGSYTVEIDGEIKPFQKLHTFFHEMIHLAQVQENPTGEFNKKREADAERIATIMLSAFEEYPALSMGVMEIVNGRGKPRRR